MFKFIVFILIWGVGCACVDYLIPNIANAWIMFAGWFTGTIALNVSGLWS